MKTRVKSRVCLLRKIRKSCPERHSPASRCAWRIDGLILAGRAQQTNQRILNETIRCFYPPMIFVRSHFVRPNLIENPSIAHDRGRLDVSDLEFDGKACAAAAAGSAGMSIR